MRQIGLPLFLKRTFDFWFSLILLACSLPFFLIAMLVVRVASPESSVLFKQERIGHNNCNMIIYKIRTMTNELDEYGELLPDEMRLKKWGVILRRTNLDELPQIWNILKGEMSLIGPRPLLSHEMTVMTDEEQKKRQSVLPGITGWEAINESKTGTRREMAEYDLYYVDNWSIGLDIKIFFYTAFIVFLNRRPGDNIRAPKMDKVIKKDVKEQEKQVIK